jgi:dolichyl-phosphate-mannose--protein O-mannosyl transferase
VTVLAGILRFWNLGHPHSLVFDETYYVKDAWSQWNLGYAATLARRRGRRLAAGETDIFTTDPSFVVHPPLGKYLIGAGMWLFGPENAFGWRFATALFGTALVLCSSSSRSRSPTRPSSPRSPRSSSRSTASASS